MNTPNSFYSFNPLFYYIKLLLSFFFILPIILPAQILYNSDDGEIGELIINTDGTIQLNPIYIPDNQTKDSVRFVTDIALHPDGKIYAVRDSFILSELDVKKQEFITVDRFSEVYTSLECDKDGIIHGAGKRAYGYYNKETKKSFVRSGLTFRAAGDLIFLNNRLLITTSQRYLLELDTQTFLYVDTLAFTDRSIVGLALSNNTLYGSSFSFEPSLNYLYQFDLENDTVYVVGTFPPSAFQEGIYLFGLTSEEQFRTNYQMYLDLDLNNSSGRFINHYQSDTFCVAQIPIADTDARLETKIRIDSVVIQIETTDLYEHEKLTISEVPAALQVSQNDRRIVLRPAPVTPSYNYVLALQQIRYDIAQAIPFQAERVVSVTLYSGNEKSDVAKAFLNIDRTRIPYAGEDAQVTVCPASSSFNPLLELGSPADINGHWVPDIGGSNTLFIPFQQPAGVYQYITQTGDCPADTANMTVAYHVVDEVIADNNWPVRLSTCPEDTLVLDITVDGGVYYQWFQTTFTPILEVSDPGPYPFELRDSNDCRQEGFFIVETATETAPPVTTMETLHFCPTAIYEYQGHLYTSDTLICETLQQWNTCGDSTHCLQLHFDQAPLLTYLDTIICEGQTLTIGEEQLTESGIYTITQSREGQCDNIVEVTLSLSPPKETIVDTLLPSGSILQFNGFSFDEPGTYFITLNAQENGCDSLIRLQLDFTTTVSTLGASYQISLLPNPAREYLQFQSQLPLTGHLQMIDLSGRVQYETIIQKTNHFIPVGQLPSGLYIVRLQTVQGDWWEKIILQ